MRKKLEELADELLVGAYDLHIHSLPSVFPWISVDSGG